MRIMVCIWDITITFEIQNNLIFEFLFISVFHKVSFITFLITSVIHMQIAYYIMRNCRNITKESSEAISLKWKRRSMMLNLLCILFAAYFFYRHNKYCEPLGKLTDWKKKNKIKIKLDITQIFFCSLLYVCIKRIWSCSFKYRIPFNNSLGFCKFFSYDIRKRI